MSLCLKVKRVASVLPELRFAPWNSTAVSCTILFVTHLQLNQLLRASRDYRTRAAVELLNFDQLATVLTIAPSQHVVNKAKLRNDHILPPNYSYVPPSPGCSPSWKPNTHTEHYSNNDWRPIQNFHRNKKGTESGQCRVTFNPDYPITSLVKGKRIRYWSDPSIYRCGFRPTNRTSVSFTCRCQFRFTITIGLSCHVFNEQWPTT